MTYSHLDKVLLVGTETSWATGGTANKTVGLLLEDVQSSVNKELIETYSIGNLGLQSLNAGVQEGKLSISGEYQHAKLFEYVFGTVAHALTSADTTHTFTLSGVTSATFLSDLNRTTDVSLAYTGMLCESAEISSVINENVKCKFEFRGKFPTVGTSAGTASQSTLSVHPHTNVSITIAGSAATEVQESTVTLTREVRLSDSLGSADHQYGAATQFKVEWSAKVGFNANTYHNLAKATEAAGNFIFAVDNGTALGSGKRAFTITVSSKTMEVNELVSVGELVYCEVKGTGTLSSCTSVDNIAQANW